MLYNKNKLAKWYKSKKKIITKFEYISSSKKILDDVRSSLMVLLSLTKKAVESNHISQKKFSMISDCSGQNKKNYPILIILIIFKNFREKIEQAKDKNWNYIHIKKQAIDLIGAKKLKTRKENTYSKCEKENMQTTRLMLTRKVGIIRHRGI